MNKDSVSLAPSVSIPLLGLGTWELRGKACENTVRMALEIGYRHIDTAHLYENHNEVRRAMEGFSREKLFITSKFFALPPFDSCVEDACNKALKELATDYLDLFLLHYPDRKTPMGSILKDLDNLKKSGKVRAIGVSNFTVRHLEEMRKLGLHAAANQVEFHPYLFQKELLEYCNKHKTRLIAFRSLGKGALTSDPIVKAIAEKHGKSIPQVLLRWATQKNIPVIPKTTSKKHLEENFAIFDFQLDDEDTKTLDSLEFQHRFCQTKWSDFDYT
ncbi:MAG: putative oxidoreductase [Chlamydiae bacterium]|nr:putative oxidoreductase [Chlamydiota bacterium]